MIEMWSVLAVNALKAAGMLSDKGHFRSSVSRSYYAAYSALAHRLTTQGVTFANEREGPGHEQVADLIECNLPGLKDWERRDLKRMTRMLYSSGIQADYSPRSFVGMREARRAVYDATRVLNRLGVDNG